MIKGVIFDLGGTLMTYEGNWEETDQQGVQALAKFLDENGLGVGVDFRARLLECRRRGWALAEETNVEYTLEQALDETFRETGHRSLDGLLPRAAAEYFAEGEKLWHAYPDAVATLELLKKRGLNIGLISNADDDPFVRRLVERLGVAPYLSPVLSSAAEPRWRKPDPRIFDIVSNAWQIAPAEIAMVGDAPRYDILGAHRAGMRGILISRGEPASWQRIPGELANDPAIHADVTVDALAQIPGEIERM